MIYCSCGTEMGAYEWQVTVVAPFDWEKRIRSIDACIFPEIMSLWYLGIETGASCCGHGVNPGSILLYDDRHVIKMLQLGYDPMHNPLGPDGFYAKFRPVIPLEMIGETWQKLLFRYFECSVCENLRPNESLYWYGGLGLCESCYERRHERRLIKCHNKPLS